MITDSQITNIGKLVKPHGINGEILITTDFDIDISAIKCFIINIDGINVPFFLNSVRSRGKESYLVLIDGINNEEQALKICNKTLCILKADIDDFEENEEGFYATDLIGYKIYLSDSDLPIGEIVDIEDSTENALFIVEQENKNITYIPIVIEFIKNISTETLTITMDLPIGLLDLN